MCIQRGADLARQDAVNRRQCDRHAASFDVPQHAGCRLFGLIGRVGCTVQSHRPGRAGDVELQRHALVPGQQLQCLRQRLRLEAFEHDQQIQRRRELLSQQSIGGIGRGSSPFDRDARDCRFHCQHRAIESRCHHGPRSRGPVATLVGWHRGCNAGELPGGLHQPAGQHVRLGREARALQQRMCREQVPPHVEADVIGGRDETAAASPVHRRFEARRKAGGHFLRPQLACQRHQLGIRKQHHGASRVGAML